jgi:hypothetical protein
MDSASYKIDPDVPTWTGDVPPEPTNADHLDSIHGWGRQLVIGGSGGLHDAHVLEHLLGTPLPVPHWHAELPERQPVEPEGDA